MLRGTCLALLAARFGGTRLIDNMLVQQREGGFEVTL